MVELIVALVGILTIMSALLLVVSVGTAHTENMMEARREAGRQAMSNLTPLESPKYIGDWSVGNDGKKLTADDRSTRGSTAPFKDNIVSKTAGNSSEWGVFASINSNAVDQLRASMNTAASFGLVKGEEQTSIPLLPVMQKLIFNSSSIDIESEVWLTHTRGIY